MKPYMAYSRANGPGDGAILIVAKNSRAARKLAWRSGEYDGWTDLAVRLIRDGHALALADQIKLAAGVEHVIAEPLACESCHEWGHGVDEGGFCLRCGGFAGGLLVEVLERFNLKLESNRRNYHEYSVQP